MTPKREAFVREYLVDLNATQAAIRAGYSKKTAGSIGEELLKFPEVAAAITSAQQKLAAKTGITTERVLEELAKLGFAQMADYVGADGSVDLSKLTREQWAAVQEITVDTIGGADGPKVSRTKLKLADKKGALETIGRHLGMFIERREVGKPGAFDHLSPEQKVERAHALANKLGLGWFAAGAADRRDH